MCFFFSSRRRHTRYWRDWSSDVCSSDLVPAGKTVVSESGIHTRGDVEELERVGVDAVLVGEALMGAPRSEERCVGKEGRSRWSPSHLKKKDILPICAFTVSTLNTTPPLF